MNAKAGEPTGFQRTKDFDFVYPGIDQDIQKLVVEGHLVEFKLNELHKSLEKKDKLHSVLYYVNLTPETQSIEVRGAKGYYPIESLNIISKLWNDPRGQLRDEDLNWQEIID